MNRITRKTPDGLSWALPEYMMIPAINKLAAYEDTGLTPEQVETLYTLTKSYPSILGVAYKLKDYTDTGLTPEVCANYKKFEDEAISKNVTFNRIVELMNAEADGRLIVLPCKVGDTIWYDTWEHGIKNIGIQPHKIDGVDVNFVSKVNEFVHTEIPLSELGKTVFLTREAAEAALKEAQQG